MQWLGFSWGDHEYYASDYFDQLYEWAIRLIKKGKAYVCELTPEEIREYRGTLKEPGKESPYRNRSIEENLDLFERMHAGEFPDGSKTLRAKVDMASPNINMRDPIMYRILRATHPRTGDKWCIYPMYDWAHGQSDSIERITHSICTLEFEDHRPLYDWFLDELEEYHPQQIEFARLNLTYMVMSKRRLLRLVKEGHVRGWDDPRMPTISGFRRKGFTPSSIRTFSERVGVAKRNSMVDYALLEFCLREELNKSAQRVMGVLHPLKVTITNYPEDQVEEMDAINNPEDESMGTRKVPFCNELYVEQTDFMEDAPKKFFRLKPGGEVRLRYAYYITCNEVIKDDDGNVIELKCTYDPESKGGGTPDGRRVKGTIHWVSARHAVPAEVRLYEHLLTIADAAGDVEEGKDFLDYMNPNSLEVLENALVEPFLKNVKPGVNLQFERHGYFYTDPDTTDDKAVFNRTTTLRDTWGKMVKQNKQH